MDLDSGRLERRLQCGDDVDVFFFVVHVDVVDGARRFFAFHCFMLTVVIVVTFVTSAHRTSVTSLVRSLLNSRVVSFSETV